MNTFKLRNILGVLLSCLLTSILFIPSVLAAGGSALEEVIVTARKREESLQDTPLAVSAFTGAALLESGVSNLAYHRYSGPCRRQGHSSHHRPGRW